ncbi:MULTISPECIES: hypothetical protein [unclassified Streptomyces]|uniref:hypothetical protein n=1 Tax=unclassified Streptomyces TaxID=2593676 RepID=UPI00364F4001
MLEESFAHFHHRPHEGLRHPVLPKVALWPNQMWAALASVAGSVPVPLSRSDYLELLPVRWQAITEHGIRLHHHTYDHDLLGPPGAGLRYGGPGRKAGRAHQPA